VLTDRDLSRQLAAEWGVEHESPQLLWKDAQGTVRHISHFGISGEWLNDLN
jgi:bacillithiol system protein YtxJ